MLRMTVIPRNIKRQMSKSVFGAVVAVNVFKKPVF